MRPQIKQMHLKIAWPLWSVCEYSTDQDNPCAYHAFAFATRLALVEHLRHCLLPFPGPVARNSDEVIFDSSPQTQRHLYSLAPARNLPVGAKTSHAWNCCPVGSKIARCCPALFT